MTLDVFCGILCTTNVADVRKIFRSVFENHGCHGRGITTEKQVQMPIPARMINDRRLSNNKIIRTEMVTMKILVIGGVAAGT